MRRLRSQRWRRGCGAEGGLPSCRSQAPGSGARPRGPEFAIRTAAGRAVSQYRARARFVVSMRGTWCFGVRGESSRAVLPLDSPCTSATCRWPPWSSPRAGSVCRRRAPCSARRSGPTWCTRAPRTPCCGQCPCRRARRRRRASGTFPRPGSPSRSPAPRSACRPHARSTGPLSAPEEEGGNEQRRMKRDG